MRKARWCDGREAVLAVERLDPGRG